MGIDKEKTKKIAKLANLYLAENEITEFTADLNKILDYVQKLDSLNTSQINPTFQVIPLKNIYREDIVRESLSQEQFLDGAPERENGFFKVPQIIEEK